jgi:hypothetical protein
MEFILTRISQQCIFSASSDASVAAAASSTSVHTSALSSDYTMVDGTTFTGDKGESLSTGMRIMPAQHNNVVLEQDL